MNLLLDTHTFIWWDSDPSKLSDKSRILISNRFNRIYLSIASLWEIQIKQNLGKLKIRKPLREIVEEQQRNNILLLNINLDHVIMLESIGDYHKDPFDRLIIAQALREDLTIITRDNAFTEYRAPLIWD